MLPKGDVKKICGVPTKKPLAGAQASFIWFLTQNLDVAVETMPNTYVDPCIRLRLERSQHGINTAEF